MGGEWVPVAPRVRVVTPVQVDVRGLTGPTPGAARGRRWRRTSAGFYIPAEVDAGLVEQRIIECAHRLRSGAVTGWAALRLLGGGYFDGLDRDGRTRLPVVLAAADDRVRSSPAVHVVRSAVGEDEVVIRYGVRCVLPERALFDQMRWARCLEERVLAMDMAAAAQLSSIRRMAANAREPRRRSGREHVLVALEHADEHALSPQEVRLRLLWKRIFGTTSLLSNPTVLDTSGRFAGMPDLLEESSGVAGEFVGAVHRTRAQHRRDVARADRFRRVGLEPVEFVGADLDDDDLVAARIHAARERAGRNPRRWTVAPADGPSLDDRLDLRDRLMSRGTNSGEHN